MAVAGGFEMRRMRPNADNGSGGSVISSECQNRDTAPRPYSARVLPRVSSANVSVQADAEMEGSDVLPIALVVPIWEQVVEHSIDVETVVEYQRANRRGDAQPSPDRVTQFQRVHPSRIRPQIPSVQK